MHYRFRVAKEDRKVYGHGTASKSFVCTVNARRYEFEDGLVVRSSDNCDPEGGVANLEHDPPLVRTSFIKENSNLFEPIGDESPEEDDGT